MALVVKNLPDNAGDARAIGLIPESREDPLEEGMATHSSILSWRIPWTEKPGRLEPIGLQRVGHDWSDLVYHLPLSCLLQPHWPSFSSPQFRSWANKLYFLCLTALLLTRQIAGFFFLSLSLDFNVVPCPYRALLCQLFSSFSAHTNLWDADSDSVDLGLDLKFYLSKELPGDADAAGGPHWILVGHWWNTCGYVFVPPSPQGQERAKSPALGESKPASTERYFSFKHEGLMRPFPFIKMPKEW